MSDFNLTSANPMSALENNQQVFELATKVKSKENKEDLKKAAEEFEAVFLNQLFQMMDKTVDRSGIMGGGNGEEVFRQMMFDTVSKDIVHRPGGSGLGMAESVYKQLERNLPAQKDAPVITDRGAH